VNINGRGCAAQGNKDNEEDENGEIGMGGARIYFNPLSFLCFLSERVSANDRKYKRSRLRRPPGLCCSWTANGGFLTQFRIQHSEFDIQHSPNIPACVPPAQF